MAQEALRSRIGETNQINPEVVTHGERDDRFTQMIEEQTARIPSVGYFGLAITSVLLSASLAAFSRRKELASFIGLWAPSFLLIGVYNKLVKLERNR